MSCNESGKPRCAPGILVSIPIGFSNELQRGRSGSLGDRDVVSIPIGFSNELQHTGVADLEDRIGVSIPIGFSNELQLEVPPVTDEVELFQSLSGFPMSCNAPRMRAIPTQVTPSFNPYRVFQ